MTAKEAEDEAHAAPLADRQDLLELPEGRVRDRVRAGLERLPDQEDPGFAEAPVGQAGQVRVEIGGSELVPPAQMPTAPASS